MGEMPLEDRVADPDSWEAQEEWCVCFVAVSRARTRLIYLPDLKVLTSSAIDALFEAPAGAAYTVPVEAPPPPSTSVPPPPVGAAPAAAEEGPALPAYDERAILKILHLPAVPETRAELFASMRGALRVAQNADRNEPRRAAVTKAIVEAKNDLIAKHPHLQAAPP